MFCVVLAALPLLFGDGAHDDTAAIQARLDAGGACVYLPPPRREYLISSTLRIGSNQELRLDRFSRIRLAKGSDCPMLENRNPESGDRSIAVIGGIWDMNNLEQRHNVTAVRWMQPEQRKEWLNEEREALQCRTARLKKFDPAFFTGACIRLHSVDDLTISGVTVRNPTTYGIQLGRVHFFKVDDITFDYTWANPAKANMDGVHLDGGCSNGRISNLRGICFDDMVALNATDGAFCRYQGPITDIDIDGIYCDYCHSAVRLLSRSPSHSIRRITIRNVHGRYYSYGIGLTYFHRDVKERGVMDGISISDCSLSRAEPPADTWQFTRFGALEIENGLDIGDLAVERLIREESLCPDIPTIRILDDVKIDRLVIRDCVQKNRTGIPMTFLRRRGKVGRLIHENTRLSSRGDVLEDRSAISEDNPRTTVDPFIGCSATGHAHPGASTPFGMVQVGPDTGVGDWGHCSGYRKEDMEILGFSHTHLNGTGCPDLCDVLVLPFTGDPKRHVGVKDAYTETSRTGYYGVWLTNFNVHVELTASPKVGWHRWTFPEGVRRKVLIDLQHGGVFKPELLHTRVVDSRLSFSEDCRSISGCNTTRGWLPERTVAFMIEFSEPWIGVEELPAEPGEKAKRIVFEFAAGDRPMLAKVAISATDEKGAEQNLAADAPGWDLDKAYALTLHAWEDLFTRVEIEADDEARINFYTALYHTLMQPNNIADAGSKPFYSTFSLWDTFRAAHPLYTIIAPEKVPDMVDSLLEHGRRSGYLPVWALWGGETQCMIGTHSVPVIVDWFLKVGSGEQGMGNREYWLAAYAQIKETLTKPHASREKEDWDIYDRYGYYPFDVIKGESVSRTLECAYDDWCAAVMAERLSKMADIGGKELENDAAFFFRRSGRWKNVLDRSVGFMRGKDTQGRWREPFDPFALGHGAGSDNDFTEGNSWQYTWHVLHDPDGLISALGGRMPFLEKLDALFGQSVRTEDWQRNVSGMIGQYAHGNEPSHHVAYLYALAGRPNRTAEIVREICDRFYRNAPDGLCGNEDCGQMGAWYVFSTIGFYPLNPCGGTYVIGAPQVRKATLRLANGRVFTVTAKNLTRKNLYVKSVMLNGKALSGRVLRHADIMRGGELVFEMHDGSHDGVRPGAREVVPVYKGLEK